MSENMKKAKETRDSIAQEALSQEIYYY